MKGGGEKGGRESACRMFALIAIRLSSTAVIIRSWPGVLIAVCLLM